MAELRPTEGHKRSASSLAKSLLHRDKSKGEDRETRESPFAEDGTNFIRAQSQEIETPKTSSFASGLSIEQSIKAFKIFELLRSGNSDAVTKAVNENQSLQGTTVLHLAIQCADPAIVEQVLSGPSKPDIDAQDKDGNTPMHLASMLGRASLVRALLDHKADSTALNYQSKSALDVARTPEIFQMLQLDRAMFIESRIAKIHSLVSRGDYEGLENLLEDAKVTSVIDVNAMELASDSSTLESGGTLLHEASRKKDTKLIQLLLLNGADPFRRDKKGRLPKDVTKDDKTKAILKKSPAATAAQRGIQEKAILGTFAGDRTMGKDSREIKGYLKKWTNYTSGYKLRWFVLEDGVLSYYKHQDDAGSACRGAMNMKIAKLSMDASDKTRFEIIGKSSVKYHLRANHEIEAKRWFWALNNAIQFAKDEAREEQQRLAREAGATRQSISERAKDGPVDGKKGQNSFSETRLGDKSIVAATAIGLVPSNTSKSSFQPSIPAASSVAGDDVGSAYESYEPSLAPNNDVGKAAVGGIIPGDVDEDEEYGDDASSHELRPAPKDAFTITAHSADLQLDILLQVSRALQSETASRPETKIDDSNVQQAISTYVSAVQSLKGMVGNLQRISKDRDAYWQYRLDREADMRQMWEESMAKVVQEQEELEGRMGESEMKRKRTKKALREALEDVDSHSRPASAGILTSQDNEAADVVREDHIAELPAIQMQRRKSKSISARRKSTIATMTDLSDSDSDLDEEFFDAVGAGEVPVTTMPVSPPLADPSSSLIEEDTSESQEMVAPHTDLSTSFSGYEDPVRTRLKMDADNRPRISLWGILKSMIGKDMTKMTLPVSFNEPTSLLQRVAEDMEYTDLLDTAADRPESSERMVYVAAFAASEYASTIGRVAKPFNPLLGETYEYARPDKGYRFFVEQVSHHPPIGAAWAESSKWDYYGESAVKSKFYGKSFDINPLGTWFLKLRPASGGPEELYTWKKVTSSVIGIITGSPTVDNYGPMEIKNWTTGETCSLDFKPRGWKASSAYQVSGKVSSADGTTRWSIGGRWNDKIYARLTPGYEDPSGKLESANTELKSHQPGSDRAFLVWQAHARPSGVPFNLTPFVLTLNAVPEKLRPYLPPTDTRLRPDQRAMEDGAYDFAATEKNRVEEKQRATRRVREAAGTVYQPKWFQKEVCKITGEEYWHTDGAYWKTREAAGRSGGKWQDVDDIF